VYAHRIADRRRIDAWIIAAVRGRLLPAFSGKFCAIAHGGGWR